MNNDDVVIRATDSPATGTSAANLPVICRCAGASLASLSCSDRTLRTWVSP